MRSREELAWAGGFFEGEGWFGAYDHNKNGRLNPMVGVSQKTLEPLERFRDAVGLGKIRHGTNRSEPFYYWQVNKFEYVQAVIAMLWPFLSRRRKDRAKEILTGFNK